MTRKLLSFVLIAAGFFVLYAATAQRGLGWGDSGEFQYRVLSCPDLVSGCASYANAHPLYLAFAKFVCRTPFHVTLVSSLFGALAVAGFYLCTHRLALTVLFGLSHMLWWLSCLAEVQTMNLALTVAETYFLLRYLETEKRGCLVATLFLSGLHLTCHNFALLALPIYGVLLLRAGVGTLLLSLAAWALGAAAWLQALVVRGARDVLVGPYGGAVSGVLPTNATVTAFNFALVALSFFVPVALVWWNRDRLKGRPRTKRRLVLWGLFAVQTLFFVRYFVPDQATFLLPTLFYAYLLIADFEPRRNRAIALAAFQILLPLFAFHLLSGLPRPAGRTEHPYRDDARYFALPWKFNETSADRCAAACGDVWNGYPTSVGEGAR